MIKRCQEKGGKHSIVTEPEFHLNFKAIHNSENYRPISRVPKKKEIEELE